MNEKEVSDAHISITYNDFLFKQVQTREVAFNNLNNTAFVDTGLLREEDCRQIIGLSML